MENILLSEIVKNGKAIVNSSIELRIDCDGVIDIDTNNFSKIYIVNNSYKVVINVSKDSRIMFSSVESSSDIEFNINGEVLYTEIGTHNINSKLTANLLSENASIDAKVLAIASNDTFTFNQEIYHKEKMTSSNIKNVGVALNSSRITFDTEGKILKGMSKTKCSQLTRGIVMDDTSSITAKPILLIDEYDCFANHGASIGKMSDDDLFYLMSRGLDKNEAFLLILQGMIKPYIDSLDNEELSNEVNENIQKMIVK